LKGQVLTADRINSFNTFKNPDEVKPRKFDAFSLKDSVITVNLPAKSVVVLELAD
jgi:alpha-N-arabinofuranosidase